MLRIGAAALERASSVLCLGAHSDDIEIGCGGTLLKLLEVNPRVAVHWVTFSANGQRAQEAQESVGAFLHDAQQKTVAIEDFRERYFPYIGTGIKEYFGRLGAQISPDLIFTHYRQDLHQDHRLIAELTWNTFRDHLILEYEIPKYDGDLGRPNIFVQLDRPVCERKVNYLLQSFKSQRGKPWFTEETFLAMLRLRGIECRSPFGYAEAFYCQKLLLM